MESQRNKKRQKKKSEGERGRREQWVDAISYVCVRFQGASVVDDVRKDRIAGDFRDFRVFADAASVFVNVYGVPLDTTVSRDTLIAFTIHGIRIFERFQRLDCVVNPRSFALSTDNNKCLLTDNADDAANYRGRLVCPTRDAKLPAYRVSISCIISFAVAFNCNCIDHRLIRTARRTPQSGHARGRTLRSLEGRGRVSRDIPRYGKADRLGIRRNLLPGWP